MLTKVAHLPGQSVRYYEVGTGPAVLLLHAFPLNADQWLPQLVRPPAGRRLIAPDLRGFGGGRVSAAAGAPEARTMDDHAGDVLALMAHLEIERAVVAGVSMGGYVAFAVRRRAPDRVAGLVLANTRATADAAETRIGRDRMIALVRREGPAALAREMVPRLLGATTQREQPDLGEALGRLIESHTPGGLAAALAAMRDRPDASGDLPAIACPTVVVAGEEDVVVPVAEAEAMARAIPGARFALLPCVGHLSNLEAPAAFAKKTSEVFS